MEHDVGRRQGTVDSEAECPNAEELKGELTELFASKFQDE